MTNNYLSKVCNAVKYNQLFAQKIYSSTQVSPIFF